MRRVIHLSATAAVLAVTVFFVVCGARQGRLAECLTLAAMICPVLLLVLALVMETLTVLFKLRHTIGTPGKKELEPGIEET